MIKAKLFVIIPALFLSSCLQTRYITEQYIKNDIEVHVPGSISAIKTYSIYKSLKSTSTSRYVELTGYKYNDQKGLVIGADRYFRTAGKLTTIPYDVVQYTYATLTEAEARALYDHLYTIRTELDAQPRPRTSEEVYRDYTVTKDVFISVRRTKQTSGQAVVHLWVKGEKYTLMSSTLPKKLRKFLEY